jgi:hypothetical protein
MAQQSSGGLGACSIVTAQGMVGDGRGFEESELIHKSIYRWTGKTI